MSAKIDSNLCSAFPDPHETKAYHKGVFTSTLLYTICSTNLCFDQCKLRPGDGQINQCSPTDRSMRSYSAAQGADPIGPLPAPSFLEEVQ